MNFYCLKVGTKYNFEFVNKLNNMISRNWPGDFTLNCITEDTFGVECNTIKMPEFRGFELQKWWNKIVLFDQNFIKTPGVFFDLDIIIRGDISWTYQPSLYTKFLLTDWVDLEQLKKDTINLRNRYCDINSSVLCWDENTERHEIFKNFISNREKITFSYSGIDTYIQHRWPKKFECYEDVSGKVNSYHKKELVGDESIILFDYDNKKQNEIDEDWIKETWV